MCAKSLTLQLWCHFVVVVVTKCIAQSKLAKISVANCSFLRHHIRIRTYTCWHALQASIDLFVGSRAWQLGSGFSLRKRPRCVLCNLWYSAKWISWVCSTAAVSYEVLFGDFYIYINTLVCVSVCLYVVNVAF